MADLSDFYALYNCLLVGVTNWGNVPFTTNSTAINNDETAFQTVGAGAHYLAVNSTNRNAGTTNINASLLAALKHKTTYPPIVLSNLSLSASTNLVPQAQRGGDVPDRGYHYDPIDYLTCWFTVSNATLTVSNGTAIACYYDTGIWIADGSSIVSIGTPLAPNWFTRHSLVQEQPVAFGTGPAAAINSFHYADRGPSGTFRFSRFSCPAGANDYHLYHIDFSGEDRFAFDQLLVRDCEFWNGMNYFTGARTNAGPVTVNNNLFHRSRLWAYNATAQQALSLSNNLVFGMNLAFYGPNSGLWKIYDNAFDTCTFILASHPITNGNNAYINCANRLNPTNASDVVLTNFNYEAGPLGNYYQPTNSPLLNAGSVTNAGLVGLYHYTVTTDQVEEAVSHVDIGFHYVGLDSSGNPLDTDNDGLPDYVEDSNGNGTFDAGDVSNLAARDTDGDGLSDFAEVRTYASNPAEAHSFNATVDDGEYLFTARGFFGTGTCTCNSRAHLHVTDLGSYRLGFGIFSAPAHATYDLYFVNSITAQRWQWRRVFSGARCDDAGEASFTLQKPDPSQGYFVILDASDNDGDGLSNGYECWFNYSGIRTSVDLFDTDDDLMTDSWEVEHGISPVVASGADGGSGNPDGDAYLNLVEFAAYSAFEGSYDPRKAYNTTANRPVVSIVTPTPYPACETASFTIHRYAGIAADYTDPLTVYYSVGGTLDYDADYSLTPAPADYPRIYSVTIPGGEQSVDVTIDAPGVSTAESSIETVVVALTPYSVSPVSQVSNPDDWQYVVDWNFNRTTITFDFEHLRPQAYWQFPSTCRNTDVSITLSGYDDCGDDLTFVILTGTGPMHGSLIDNTPPGLIYRPNNDYEGPDNFQFKVNDGLRDSVPATISIAVGSPPTAESVTRVAYVDCPIKITMGGSDGCDGTDVLTFAIVTPPTLGTLCGDPPNVTYISSTAGSDSFTFKVNDGVHDSSPASVSINVIDPESDSFWSDSGPTKEQLAEWLSAPGDNVANVTYTGTPIARGSFGGGLSAGLPFNTGIILSSGSIHLATGPNSSPGAGLEHDRPGDSNLDELLDTIEDETSPEALDTKDAAVLEYDLTPSTNILQFDYVFASEEYPEYLDDLKNDAIAIFVDGQNIAWVPGTTNEPVCVFTINGGRNSDYYQDNPEFPDEVFGLQYDGFTSTATHPWLTAAVEVEIGVPVHIKIVIADEDDWVWDSALFLRAKRPLPCDEPCE